MTDEALDVEVHHEFEKRVNERFERIDGRLKVIDAKMDSYTEMAVAINKLSVSMEHMCKEQERHTKQLDILEARDGEKWRQMAASALTVIVGAILGFVMANMGIVG